MLSIGRFAKLARVSPRTLRHYESLGLIASSRGENKYRYYERELLKQVDKIRRLQELGFSLDEIKEVLKISDTDLEASLMRKLDETRDSIAALNVRRERILAALSVCKKIDSRESINEHEKEQFMNTIREEIVSGLKSRCGKVTPAQLGYLERDQGIQTELAEAIKKCVAFAQKRGLTLGPGRGSSPASISLYGLGLSAVDPIEHQLIPERLWRSDVEIHIDVEFELGQEFVDYCREISRGLSTGRIEAFKMPLIDIVKNVDRRLGRPMDYASIDDDSDTVLECFRNADIEKIFQFDFSPHALVMKYENFLPEYIGTARITEYLKTQKIHDFRDIINMTALWRPFAPQMLERIERYRNAKQKPFRYPFLTRELQKSLEPNFGLIIYHEDVIRIIAAYTDWNLERCNSFRRGLFGNKANPQELEAFKRAAPREVAELVLEEGRWAFCQPHAIAFAQFTRQTAVLKNLHRELYFREVSSWEQKNGFAWDDIGIRLDGVSLLQN
jgi:DNA-binding transcriptional MerR regulator